MKTPKKKRLPIDEHLIKISAGYISLNQSLDIDQDVEVTITGSVTKIEDKSNQDGSINRIYTIKGAIGEVNI